MAKQRIRETFFIPEQPVAVVQQPLPAPLINGLQLLRLHAGGDAAFLPIRNMQYLAVIDRQEILFIDGQGGYAHQAGVGGRLVQLLWRPARGRESLSAPVPCEIVYYLADGRQTQTRLLSELGRILQQSDTRHRPTPAVAWTGQVLPLRRDA